MAVATKKNNVKDSAEMNKVLIQWLGIAITVATVLIAIGGAKTKIETIDAGYKEHCNRQATREDKIDNVLQSLAISVERLNTNSEYMVKSIDEIKAQVKTRK